MQPHRPGHPGWKSFPPREHGRRWPSTAPASWVRASHRPPPWGGWITDTYSLALDFLHQPARRRAGAFPRRHVLLKIRRTFRPPLLHAAIDYAGFAFYGPVARLAAAHAR